MGGQVPTANHVVRIRLGHTVTIDDTSAVAYTVAVDGKLAFAPTVNTRLKVTNLEVMAGEMGMGTPGVLEVGTTATPIAAGVIAEIVIANSPLGGSVSDTDQFGTGIVVLGKASMHGSVKTPTFVRLATEPRAGNTTLTLSVAVAGWRVGDRLVLPDTRHIKVTEVSGGGWTNAVNQWEERTVQAISADGLTLTLNSGLQYDHLGARDLNNVLDFLPHVGNLTRNVIVRSESATGTRGHMLGIHMADLDIRYALFKDLGRTTYLPLNDNSNHIGRYPIHVHHLSGPLPTPANGYQFTLLGNAVDGGSVETKFKWGITVHGSHYGTIKDNVVYNYNGAAIATEDGSESFNVFDHNFTLRGIGEPTDSVSEARMAMGTEGVGFWFRGPNNYVKNNVAANYQNETTEASYGFAIQLRFLGNIAVPNSKGAMDASQFTTRNGNNMPILQFENNEAYGAMQGGFTQWWVNSEDPAPAASAQESVIKDLKLWNIYNKTVYMYPGQKITFDGLKIRGNYNAGGRCCGNGVYFADYSSKGIVIRNSDIQGMNAGITAPEAGFGPEPQLTIENSYLRNNANIDVPTNGSVNGCWMSNKLVVASNTRFDTPPGRGADHISMIGDIANAQECLGKLDEMRVYAYNGVATDNFQVYHPSSSVIPRPSCGSPVTRAGINGPTCPIAALGPVPPTATLSAAPASVASGQSATLSWSATNATTISINQGVGTVAVSGTRSVSPTATTIYTLTATNAAGSVTAIATVTVTTGPSVAAQLVSPAPGSNLAATSQTFIWNAGTGVSSYKVDVGTVVGGRDIYTGVAGTGLSATVTGLPTNGALVWVRLQSMIGGAWQSADYPFKAFTSTLGMGVRPDRSDFDGDGKTDIAVFRPSTGDWFIMRSGTGNTSNMVYTWGASTDVIVPGDYDGDGLVDPAVFRPATGMWYIHPSTGYTVNEIQAWGGPGDVPVPGDYDGDGKNDLALYRPSTGMWYIKLSNSHYATSVAYQWGTSADVPVAGDYDGDGKTDVAVYRPSTGVWSVLQSSTSVGMSFTQTWGLATDQAVPGDYDGDGKTDFALYRPSTGEWQVRQSSTNYLTVMAYQWGIGTDVVVPGDYDGDRRTDFAVYRPSTGTWYVSLSSTRYTSFLTQQWGGSTDIAVFERP